MSAVQFRVDKCRQYSSMQYSAVRCVTIQHCAVSFRSVCCTAVCCSTVRWRNDKVLKVILISDLVRPHFLATFSAVMPMWMERKASVSPSVRRLSSKPTLKGGSCGG